MAKRTAGLDSAHQTGQTTPPSDVLIVDEDAHGKGLKNCDVEDVFEYEGRTNRDMAKWMTPIERKIALESEKLGPLIGRWIPP